MDKSDQWFLIDRNWPWHWRHQVKRQPFDCRTVSWHQTVYSDREERRESHCRSCSHSPTHLHGTLPSQASRCRTFSLTCTLARVNSLGRSSESPPLRLLRMHHTYCFFRLLLPMLTSILDILPLYQRRLLVFHRYHGAGEELWILDCVSPLFLHVLCWHCIFGSRQEDVCCTPAKRLSHSKCIQSYVDWGEE